MTAPVLPEARAIVAGTSRPWWHRSDIASPADWRIAAQCALDGDEADLRFYLAELASLHDDDGPVLPDNEDWKHDAAVAALRCDGRRKAA